jgi:GH35 family endo-1,4-beta-xylanase
MLTARCSFRVYAETEVELFIESMQDAADNEWNSIRWRMEGASMDDIGAEMHRWWTRQIGRFRIRLRIEREKGRRTELKRERRRETRRYLRELDRRIQAEQKSAEKEEELDQKNIDLEIQKDLTTYLKETVRCRNCDGPILN